MSRFFSVDFVLLILFALLAYPLYIVTQYVYKIVSYLIIKGIEACKLERSNNRDVFIREIASGRVRNEKDAEKYRIKYERMFVAQMRVVQQIDKLGRYLDEDVVTSEINVLKGKELESRAYSYAASLLERDSQNREIAAINLFTYLKRLHLKILSRRYFESVIFSDEGVENDTILYNLMMGAKEQLENTELTNLCNEAAAKGVPLPDCA